MTAVRDVSREEDDSALPTSLRLLDVLDLEPPAPDRIAELWRANGRTTRRADRRVRDRHLRRRHEEGRAARAGRRHHRLRQVRAAAVDHRRRSRSATRRTR
jgi:hypothetical protein